MSKDNLGDRIKRYEIVAKPYLTRRMPVIIRVDGKAFHTFTKNFDKPFDKEVVEAMAYATGKTAQAMQGFKLAYVQSDEASFLITDYGTLGESSWFDYELNKIVSITASTFTYWFNKKWFDIFVAKTNPTEWDKEKAQRVALFDARAFNIPEADWPNAFIWRQQDWERNSIQMLARSLYSQKYLDGKKVPELMEMTKSAGKDWEGLHLPYKWGTFIKRDGHSFFGKADYSKIVEMAGKLIDD